MFFFEMGREKADTCEASCLAAASFCAVESAAYVRDVYRLPGTYLRAGIELARSATSWQLAVACPWRSAKESLPKDCGSGSSEGHAGRVALRSPAASRVRAEGPPALGAPECAG